MNRLVTLVSAIVLTFSLFAIDLSNPSASAQASCSQAQINLYRDADFLGGGLAICYDPLNQGVPGGITNLADYGFDNVTSSIRWIEAPTKSLNTTVCVYTFPSYVGLIKKFTVDGETANWHWWDGENDQVSSVKFAC